MNYISRLVLKWLLYGYLLSSQDKILHPTRIPLNAGNDIKCYQFDNVPLFVLKGFSYKHKRQKVANCNI